MTLSETNPDDRAALLPLGTTRLEAIPIPNQASPFTLRLTV